MATPVNLKTTVFARSKCECCTVKAIKANNHQLKGDWSSKTPKVTWLTMVLINASRNTCGGGGVGGGRFIIRKLLDKALKQLVHKRLCCTEAIIILKGNIRCFPKNSLISKCDVMSWRSIVLYSGQYPGGTLVSGCSHRWPCVVRDLMSNSQCVYIHKYCVVDDLGLLKWFAAHLVTTVTSSVMITLSWY